uniref:Uncharacterized protein n=1 Tax=Oryza rufipogon TaxID=4529 RepID=A0A0E0NT37_ORYRU
MAAATTTTTAGLLQPPSLYHLATTAWDSVGGGHGKRQGRALIGSKNLAGDDTSSLWRKKTSHHRANMLHFLTQTPEKNQIASFQMAQGRASSDFELKPAMEGDS